MQLVSLLYDAHGLTALLSSVHYNVKVYEARIVSALTQW